MVFKYTQIYPILAQLKVVNREPMLIIDPSKGTFQIGKYIKGEERAGDSLSKGRRGRD